MPIGDAFHVEARGVGLSVEGVNERVSWRGSGQVMSKMFLENPLVRVLEQVGWLREFAALMLHFCYWPCIRTESDSLIACRAHHCFSDPVPYGQAMVEDLRTVALRKRRIQQPVVTASYPRLLDRSRSRCCCR